MLLDLVGTIGRERGRSPPSRQQFEATCGPGGAYLIGDRPEQQVRIQLMV